MASDSVFYGVLVMDAVLVLLAALIASGLWTPPDPPSVL